MKIYSQTLTIEDLAQAAAAIPAVHLNGEPVLINGRKRRIEGVTIRATTAERMPDWRERDDSAYRSGRAALPQFATYNEHGQWMARLFELDPQARIVSAVNDFNGVEDFHRQTSRRYCRQLVI